MLDPNYLKVNQKFDLIAALLEIGDSANSDILLDRLKEFKPTSHPKISYFIFKRIHDMLKPLSNILEKSAILAHNNVQFVNFENISRDDAVDVLYKVMIHLKDCSPFLYREITLFSKICRLLIALFVPESKFSSLADDMIRSVLLPAFSLIPSNVGISADLWNLLKLFDYTERFSWYSFWKNDVYSSCTEVNFHILAKFLTVKISF